MGWPKHADGRVKHPSELTPDEWRMVGARADARIEADRASDLECPDDECCQE